jgi:RNA polymerase sigma-70 factor, ECF subfamily
MAPFTLATGRSMESSADSLDWDRVYREHLPRIFNYFRFRFGPGVDVEDLTSRTFEKAWRARRRYRQDLAGFSTWLLSIARNVGTDHHRAEPKFLALDAVVELPDPNEPHEEASRISDLARLAKLTVLLSDRERELIALKYGATARNQTIAEITGLSESNVAVILHRAVQSLRAHWYR